MAVVQSAARKLARIVLVDSVRAHPNADRLSVAHVQGWQIVIQRDEYKAGDLAVYCEIDSIIPPKILEGRREYEILAPKAFTIKTVKLRQELSQGILFPLEILNNCIAENGEPVATVLNDEKGYRFGEIQLIPELDVTDLMGITKHEQVFEQKSEGDAMFPVHLFPKTDEERVQNLTAMLAESRGLAFVATEKLDGTSFTCFMKNGVFGVCSRNLHLNKNDGLYWKTAVELNLEDRLREAGVDNICLQGEMLGPGIQGNKYNLPAITIYFFNVYDIDQRRYYDAEEAIAFAQKLGLQWVPVVFEAFVLEHDTAALLDIAIGPSLLHPQTKREGLVFRRRHDSELSGRVSFKVISNEFLLHWDNKDGSAPSKPKKESQPKKEPGKKDANGKKFQEKKKVEKPIAISPEAPEQEQS